MTEKERWQGEEIERLQKKLKTLSEAYSHATAELEQLKKEEKLERKKGRPAIPAQTKAQILALCRQGESMRRIADRTGTSLGTVHKVIAKAEQESRIIYVYLDWEEPATLIDAYGFTRRVRIMNFTDDMLSRAFGINETPDWEELEWFLEERCMPRTRYGIREEMRYMGLDVYDPFQIVMKTKGRVYGDGQSLEQMRKDWIKQCDEIWKTRESIQEQKDCIYNLLCENRGKWEVQDEET